MKNQKMLEYISALLALIYGGAFLLGGLFMDTRGKAGDVGSAFMPVLVGIVIVGLSAIYLVLLLVKKGPRPEGPQPKEPAAPYSFKGVLLTSALLLAYVLLLPFLGFVLSSILYLFAQMMLLATHPTARQKLLYGGLSLVVPILVYYIFTNGFSLLLPTGFFG